MKRVAEQAGPGVYWGVKVANATLCAVLLSALSGCGGIDSIGNALATGEVKGSLTNARPGAYAYVLGHPEIRAEVRGDGSFELQKVPLGNGAAKVVVYDGGPVGDGRAELVDVQVKPAERTHIEKDATQMPLAGSIVAVVQCRGGQRGDKASYSVEGTEFDGRHGSDSLRLFPLPAGAAYTLTAALSGFKKTVVRDITVDAGSDRSVSVEMDVDDGADRRGCLSVQCSGGLSCDGDDGRCYQCVKRNGVVTGCDPGLDCEEHRCVSGGNDLRSACLPCTSDGQCLAGPAVYGSAPGMCIPSGLGHVCSHGCVPENLDTDCPSGYVCRTGAGSGGQAACVAEPSCSAVLQAFWQPCTENEGAGGCSSALADAKCYGLVKDHSTVLTPGHCTSRCTVADDCPIALGFRCEETSRGLLCVR